MKEWEKRGHHESWIFQGGTKDSKGGQRSWLGKNFTVWQRHARAQMHTKNQKMAAKNTPKTKAARERTPFAYSFCRLKNGPHSRQKNSQPRRREGETWTREGEMLGTSS
jgi:hypothetical protein